MNGWALTVAAALAGQPFAAMSCVPMTQEMLADHARQATDYVVGEARTGPGVVYAVVDRDIGGPDRKTGVLRVLHSYRGAFSVGDKIMMRPGLSPWTTCTLGYVEPTFRKGDYGVVVLSKAPDGQEPLLNGFVPEPVVQRLIGDGIITSAQGGASPDERR